MSIKFQKAGILTSLQDEGRKGYASGGINVGGVMDWFAFRILNKTLGNESNEAAIEMHFPAPIVQFLGNANCCLTGADFWAKLNGKPLEINKSFRAEVGDELRFTSHKNGCRAYFGVEGGLESPSWLGSVSPNKAAGFSDNFIQEGQILRLKNKEFSEQSIYASTLIYPEKKYEKDALRIRYIPENEAIAKQIFEISNEASRMGYRLKGQPIELTKSGIVSSAVTFGTIQQLPDGQLIILTADHQTSGGYPRLGTVIKADLPLLAQAKPSDKIYLEPCSMTDAEEAYLKIQRKLEILGTSVSKRKTLGDFS